MSPAAATITRFDLETVHPSRRRRAWSDILYENYYPLDLASPESFGIGRLVAADIAGIRVAELTSDPMRVERNAGHLAKGVRDFYFLPMPVSESILLSQRGCDAVVGPGSFAYVATTEAYAYDQKLTDTLHTLRIPGSALRDRTRHADDLAAVTFGDTAAMTRIFLRFARSFCEDGASVETTLGERVADHLLDLLALALNQADPHCDETDVRLAHRQRALHFIETRFRDPGFCAGSLAQALRISERYLQKIFAEREETVSAVIRRRRVAEARRLLANRATSQASVSQIAYAVGFADPAYFSRVFRRETGVAPTRMA